MIERMSEDRFDGREPVDYVSLTHEQRMAALLELQRDRARLEAAEARLMACIAEHPHPDPALNTIAVQKRYAADEIAVALRIAPQTGRARMEQAVRLVQRLPDTLAAVEAGALPFFFARALARETECLPADVVAKVEAKALERAERVPDQSFGAFTRALRRSVLAVDPRGAEQKFTDAYDQRRVCDQPDGNGMGWVSAYLPDHARQGLLNRLSHAARQSKRAAQPGDDRTMDQREADALTHLALTGTLAGVAAATTSDATSDTTSDTTSADTGTRAAESAGETTGETTGGTPRGAAPAAASQRPPRGRAPPVRSRSASSSPPPPWPATTTSPARSTASDPSPPPWPARSPSTRTPSGADSSPTRPDG